MTKLNSSSKLSFIWDVIMFSCKLNHNSNTNQFKGDARSFSYIRDYPRRLYFILSGRHEIIYKFSCLLAITSVSPEMTQQKWIQILVFRCISTIQENTTNYFIKSFIIKIWHCKYINYQLIYGQYPKVTKRINSLSHETTTVSEMNTFQKHYNPFT